jgi:hypothetical protein
MKFSDFKKAMTPLEITALVIFVVYLVFPFKTPLSLTVLINSPLGILAMIVITVALFMYSHPALGVLYLFVAYEMLRRAGNQFIGQSEPLGTSFTKATMNPYTSDVTVQYEQSETSNLNEGAPVSEMVGALENVDSITYAPVGENSYGMDENGHVMARLNPVHETSLEEQVVGTRTMNAALGDLSSGTSSNFTTTYSNSKSLLVSPI